VDGFQILGDILAAEAVASSGALTKIPFYKSKQSPTVHFVLADHVEMGHAQQFQRTGVPGK